MGSTRAPMAVLAAALDAVAGGLLKIMRVTVTDGPTRVRIKEPFVTKDVDLNVRDFYAIPPSDIAAVILARSPAATYVEFGLENATEDAVRQRLLAELAVAMIEQKRMFKEIVVSGLPISMHGALHTICATIARRNNVQQFVRDYIGHRNDMDYLTHRGDMDYIAHRDDADTVLSMLGPGSIMTTISVETFWARQPDIGNIVLPMDTMDRIIHIIETNTTLQIFHIPIVVTDEDVARRLFRAMRTNYTLFSAMFRLRGDAAVLQNSLDAILRRNYRASPFETARVARPAIVVDVPPDIFR
jgi:hypothetical protein